MMASISGRGRGRSSVVDHRHDRWRFLRRWWPVAPVILSGLVLALAFWLDAGGSRERDAALLIGSLALYLFLPLSVLTMVVVLTMRRRAKRRTPFRPPTG